MQEVSRLEYSVHFIRLGYRLLAAQLFQRHEVGRQLAFSPGIATTRSERDYNFPRSNDTKHLGPIEACHYSLQFMPPVRPEPLIFTISQAARKPNP